MKVGILGGGQLARLLILAGKPLGFDFVVLTPRPTATTAHLADHVIGELHDREVLDQFLQRVDVVTYENENIAGDIAGYLAARCPLYPDKRALATAQDRLNEKRFFRQLGIPTNAFYAVDCVEDLKEAATALGFPFRLKSRFQGYDGKYQYHLTSAESVQQLASTTELSGHIAEAFVDFEREISVIATRDQHNNRVFYDICENTHDQGILHATVNRRNDSLAEPAFACLAKILEALDYVGTIAVEFFVRDQALLANEIAPRVHNSGHWTIDACNTSQFENHVRAITAMPLGDSTALFDACMYNVISCWPDRQQLLSISKLSLHDYQKKPRKGRKLGHITCAATTALPPALLAQLRKHQL